MSQSCPHSLKETSPTVVICSLTQGKTLPKPYQPLSAIDRELLSKRQCKFYPSGGTMDMINMMWQPQYKYRNYIYHSTWSHRTSLKSFDSNDQEELWHTLHKFKCLQKLISILYLYHDGMQAMISSKGLQQCQAWAKTCVKHYFHIAPRLFLLCCCNSTPTNFLWEWS